MCVELPVKFRFWEIVEFRSLQETIRHTSSVKTSSKVKSPRHALDAIQMYKRCVLTVGISTFDHCTLRNIWLVLKTERYEFQRKLLSLKKQLINF